MSSSEPKWIHMSLNDSKWVQVSLGEFKWVQMIRPPPPKSSYPTLVGLIGSETNPGKVREV